MLGRLERIAELERAGAGPEALLDELRALVCEAEAWSRREGDRRAEAAAARCRAALGGVAPAG